MQKKIIALVVAGLVSGAVYAQTNVTIYGRVDLGYVYSKSDYKKFQGVVNGDGLSGGPSMLGFRGDEALGNGLKAVFKFEWELDADRGQGPSNPVYTYVGLSGKFGEVLLGRNGTPADYYLSPVTLFYIGGNEPINRFRFNMPLVNIAHRWDNAITYNSPNFSGLEFMAIYSFGEEVNSNKAANGDGYSCTNPAASTGCHKGADTSDANKLGLGVRYANGPLYLAALYHAQADDDSAREVDATNWRTGHGAKGWGIGGTYDFKAAKVYANYFRVKANHNGLANGVPDGGSDKQTAWSVGVGIRVGSAGMIALEYGQYKDSLNNVDRYEWLTDSFAKIADPNNPNAGHKAKGYGLGYWHALSKRTSVYTYVSRFDNDRSVNAGWAGTGVAGEKQTNFQLGIVHNF